jgi:hypothetical protein
VAALVKDLRRRGMRIDGVGRTLAGGWMEWRPGRCAGCESRARPWMSSSHHRLSETAGTTRIALPEEWERRLEPYFSRDFARHWCLDVAGESCAHVQQRSATERETATAIVHRVRRHVRAPEPTWWRGTPGARATTPEHAELLLERGATRTRLACYGAAPGDAGVRIQEAVARSAGERFVWLAPPGVRESADVPPGVRVAINGSDAIVDEQALRRLLGQAHDDSPAQRPLFGDDG